MLKIYFYKSGIFVFSFLDIQKPEISFYYHWDCYLFYTENYTID